MKLEEVKIFSYPFSGYWVFFLPGPVLVRQVCVCVCVFGFTEA